MEPKENNSLTEPQLYVVSDKYGTTESYTGPGFLENSKKIENTYDMEVPEEVLDLCREIRGLGGTALLVGGSVRDMVVNTEFKQKDITYKDLDFEIYGLSRETVRLILLEKFGEENINDVGKSYGITKVKIKNLDEPLDISIPRRDSKSGITHKDFDVKADPSMNIQEASFRRDLSMNCLGYDPLTQILFDPYNGVEDIKNRTINVIDEKTFEEDPLRVMRVMQFLSRFEFTPSNKTLRICKQMTSEGQLDNLSKSRVSGEFYKLLVKGIRPSIGLEFARETGILERYWPELNALVGVQQPEKYHPEGDVWTHTLQVVDAGSQIAKRENMNDDNKIVFMLACICHDMGKATTTEFIDGKWRAWGHEEAGVSTTKNFLDRFSPDIIKLDQRKKVLPLVAEHLKPITLHEEFLKGNNMNSAIKRLSVRLSKGYKNYPNGGNTSIGTLALVSEADQRGRNANSTLPLKESEVSLNWKDWILKTATDLGVRYKPKIETISGTELMNLLEKKPGPWIGAVLKALEKDWTEGLLSSNDIIRQRAIKHYLIMTEHVNKRLEELGKLDRDSNDSLWSDISKMEDPRTLEPRLE